MTEHRTSNKWDPESALKRAAGDQPLDDFKAELHQIAMRASKPKLPWKDPCCYQYPNCSHIVEAQAADIERLTETQRNFGVLQHKFMSENERLRAVVKDISTMDCMYSGGDHDSKTCECLVGRAERSLGPANEPGDIPDELKCLLCGYTYGEHSKGRLVCPIGSTKFEAPGNLGANMRHEGAIPAARRWFALITNEPRQCCPQGKAYDAASTYRAGDKTSAIKI